MDFVSEPPIADKIREMKQRVRWQEPPIVERGIDQTCLVLDDGIADNPEFSFMVVGDTGFGSHKQHDPQRQLAELMLTHSDNSRFVLHMGDVVYQVGSSEYYPQNFIKPYREFLVGGEHPNRIAYDQMTFKLPFLPIPGNHDYYDLPLIYGLMAQVTWPLRHLFKSKLDLNVGWHGSDKGKAYAKAFLDYLTKLNLPGELERHLDNHYTAKTNTGRCLRYEPGRFTRLPNRYYTFRSGGIDFFALDSNTFNSPSPIPNTSEGEAFRHLLETRLSKLEQEKLQIMEMSANLNPDNPEEAEQLDDLNAKMEQIEEITLDIEKQLESDENTVIDFEQLDWLRQKLIDSWHTEEVRGRVIYLHHPPYVTEATKWQQAQTRAVRRRLRQVLDAVSEGIGSLSQGRPLVELILTGHAHCLEYLHTVDTGHADSHIPWIICGGSGHSLRRQRQEGSEIRESIGFTDSNSSRLVAQSKLYVGRHGHGSKKRRPYSFLRVDVQEGCPPKFVIRPFIAERYKRQWSSSHIEPFVL
ncbi:MULTISPECIES: metallophosphoesterase family protein [unclassified Coleofasciculus]|uniref:metallophosphoesterase family protein n=1 Tax=unclassified Coleofasciculus TaxID=2692782 RepID=UPI00187FD5FE|nr:MULTISPECIES: metallophosphoesterase [unclassified Coleofasciculus]MBE9127174.1 metallophosphoesterase [Coleofasciculus sp. LEGE 07081]MBE9150495.1 metallophosphoesterase [Coleofasciculus sp. LEGE 07092]